MPAGGRPRARIAVRVCRLRERRRFERRLHGEQPEGNALRLRLVQRRRELRAVRDRRLQLDRQLRQLADRLRGPGRLDLGAVHRQHADDQLRVRHLRKHDLRPGDEPAVALSLDRPRQDMGVEGHHAGPRPLPVRLARSLGGRKQARHRHLLPAEQRLRLAGLRVDLQPVAETRAHIARPEQPRRARERGGAG